MRMDRFVRNGPMWPTRILNVQLFATAVLLCFLQACGRVDSDGETFELERDSVRIAFPTDKSDLEVGSLRDENSTRFSSVPSANRKLAIEFIDKALSRYPSGFLTKYVDRIYVFGSLTVDGIPAGGTYDRPSTIYAIYDPSLDEFWLEHCLHAEVSSILYHQVPKVVASVGLTYQLDYGLGDTAENFSLAYDEKYLKRGYLYAYAASSIEEDFNSLIAALLAGDRMAWQYAAEYNRFGKKFKKAKACLRKLDDRFTEQYLWNIAQSSDRDQQPVRPQTL